MIICPNCKALLKQVDRTYRCPKGHSFDVAKGGYVNLLLPNKKKSSAPGDNKEMINARETFLASGAFDFLYEGIESLLDLKDLPSTEDKERAHLLDLGCGTGFYTRSIYKTENFNRIGIDISKVAVAKAASLDKRSTYIVGSVFDLPFKKNAVDLALNIFSPVRLAALIRVLKPGGYYVKVIPTGEHMKQVAELVYDKFIPHTSTIKAEIEDDSRLNIVDTQQLKKNIILSKEDLANLISMTPYVYKFSEEKIASLKDMEVTLSFEIILAMRR